jgi:SAM-dependent methyltransferase
MSAEYFTAGSLDYAKFRPRYPVEWFDWLAVQVDGRSLAWDCACGSVDLVTVAQALHWLDLGRFWQECRRVSKPGGIIAVWGYGIAGLQHEAANRIFQDYYHGMLGEFWPKERRMVEEGYKGIDFPFHEIQVPPFEMRQLWDADHIAGYCASWSATDRYRKAIGRDPIPGLRDKLGRELGENLVEIRWPFFARVGRVFHVEQKPG